MISSLITNLRLELTLRKTRISTYIYILLMFVFGALFMLIAGGLFSEVNVVIGSSKAALNGPLKLHEVIAFISLVGLLICGPIFGQTVCKDYEAKFDQIVFATPTQRIGFYLGRFAGAILLSLIISAGFGLGLWLATYAPGLQRSLFQDNRFIYYFMPYATAVLPNILIFGSLFFTIAAFTRRMGAVYVAGIILLLGYLLAISFAGKVDLRMLRSLIDPFGNIAAELDTEYWAPFDQNTRLVGFQGYLLINRLVWLAVSGALFVVGLVLTQKEFKIASKKPAEPATPIPAAPVRWQATRLVFDASSRIALLWRQVRFETRSAFKNIYFLCLALAGVIFLFSNAQYFGELHGTKVLPVTYNMVGGVLNTFGIFMIAIIIFYTGELIWRERQHRMQQILDALPQPAWVPLVSKFLALQAIILSLLAIISVCGVLVQLVQGYTRFELGQVAISQLTIAYPHFMILSAIVLCIHVLVDNKYVGHTVATGFVLLQKMFLTRIGVEHSMLIPGKVRILVPYSDMNGYGPFLLGVRSYQIYWGFFALGLLVVAYLYWPFGTDSALSLRQRLARQRWTRPLALITALVVAGFAGAGGFIYYNTMVLNEFHKKIYYEKRQLAYEKTYKTEWDRKDQLQIVAVNAQVDITPELPALKATMDYTLTNAYQHPIDTLFLNMPMDRKQYTLAFDKGDPEDTYDAYHQVHILRLKEPIPPGGELRMTYKLDYQPRGFNEEREELRLVRNGTFFNSFTYFPSIGYQRGMELDSDKDREKYGLTPKPTANPISDTEALAFTDLGRNGNWIRFEATVSTTGNQIALAPGYLEKEWKDGDRHYFHYKMDSEILNFYAFMSADYATKTDTWNDMPITVYHHKDHPYNVDIMIQAAKDGLDYFSRNFSPYQFRQFRILEFPRYESFAQAFPNTVPFSESMGFIAQVNDKDPDDYLYPYVVTAHELAHQWWAHQVIGGDVQGTTMLVESLAQYSAAMVLEKKYGREKVERFLRHELQRYFFGRSTESKREWPLALNEGQGYLHYGKGVAVMYALKEVVGEEAMNAALKKFADGVRFQKPPFTTGLALVESLKASLDPKYSDLIDDLLMKVILYDNRIQSHTVTENKDGSVTVDLEVFGRKLDVDAKGEQKEIDFALDVEIAGRGEDDKFLPGTHHVIKAGVNKIQLHFAKKPKSISLDPIGIWIDTNREDNKVNL